MTSVISILVSPVVWLAAFSAIYGLQGLVCELDLEGTTFAGFGAARALLGLAWIAAIGVQAALLAALYSQRLGPRSPFVRWVSRATGWTGLVAVIWTLFPVVAASTCG